MAFESDEAKAGAIDYGTRTPFWTDFLLPELQAKGKQFMEQLAAKRSDDDDIKRGWVQAIRWVIALPNQIVEHQKVVADEAARAAKLVDMDNFRAEYGYRTPLHQTPGPGELTSEDSGTGE